MADLRAPGLLAGEPSSEIRNPLDEWTTVFLVRGLGDFIILDILLPVKSFMISVCLLLTELLN